LSFVYDSSIEYGARIEALLQQVKKDPGSEKEEEDNG
jgi:ribosome-binding factor A